MKCKMATELINKAVTTEEKGARLDRCLRLWIPHLQQSLIEKAVRKGEIRVDGRKTKTSARLDVGQSISFPEQFQALADVLPIKTKKPLTHNERKWIKSLIIFEDKDIVVINKPANVPVQKGTKQYKAIDSLMECYYEEQKVRLVHRLDKDTSGVLVLARTLQMARWLTQAFKERTVSKVYWALVCGVPPKKEGLISLSLTKQADPVFEKVHVNEKDGLHATTYYRVLESLGNDISWVELSPKTGRTHQLRVHCAEGLKTPIIGDGKYGGKTAFPLGRTELFLHARSITIPLPSGKNISFTAPLPSEMQTLYIDLGFK